LFVDGSMNWLRTYDAPGLLAYERVRGDQRAIVAFNVSAAPVEASFAADGSYRVASPAGGGTTVTSGELRTQLPPRAARVWIRE
jgi:glycosidase